jgi:hypothetical protein
MLSVIFYTFLSIRLQLLAKNYGMRHWQTDSHDLERSVPFIDESFTLKAYDELEKSLYF